MQSRATSVRARLGGRGPGGDGDVDEQLDRRMVGELLRGGVRVRRGERLDAEDGLAGQVQGGPAGDQEAQVVPRREQTADRLGRVRCPVCVVDEHQQGWTGRRPWVPSRRVVPLLGGEAGRHADPPGQQAGLVHLVRLDPGDRPRPRPCGVHEVPGEARFPCSRKAGQGEQALGGIAQQARRIRQCSAAPTQRGTGHNLKYFRNQPVE
jgi:hypothetical protein